MTTSAEGWVFRTLARDPLWLREWRACSRLLRTPWLLAGCTLGMTAILVLMTLSRSTNEAAADVGQLLFHTYFGIAALFVTLIGPAIAANSVTLEREGRTWEALVMAGALPRAIDRGKFLGAFTHLALYVFALLPCAAVPHFFGGVSHISTITGVFLVFALGAIAVRIGLLVSAALPTTRIALLGTVILSAVLCFGLTALGWEGSRWVSRVFPLAADLRNQTVFWPLALVRAELGAQYLRYLVAIPGGLALIGWFALRELTVSTLTPRPRDARRSLRIAFVILAPALAVLLGLIPSPERYATASLLQAQAFFAVCMILAIVFAAGERSKSTSSIGSSALLIAASTFGLAAIPYEALGITRWRYEVGSYPDEPIAMTVYGSAFLSSLVGIAAYVRARFGRSSLTRIVVVASAFAILVVPAFVSQVLPLLEMYRATEIAKALSPVIAIDDAEIPERFIGGSIVWAAVGAMLLFRAHAREKRAAAQLAATVEVA